MIIYRKPGAVARVAEVLPLIVRGYKYAILVRGKYKRYRNLEELDAVMASKGYKREGVDYGRQA